MLDWVEQEKGGWGKEKAVFLLVHRMLGQRSDRWAGSGC